MANPYSMYNNVINKTRLIQLKNNYYYVLINNYVDSRLECSQYVMLT